MEMRAIAEPFVMNASRKDNPEVPAAVFENAISLRDMLTKKQLTVWLLPIQQFPSTAPSAGKTVLHSLPGAARLIDPDDRRHVVVFCDEAQHLFKTEDMNVLPTMGREDGFTYVIITQNLSTLRSRGSDVASVVLNNTQTQLFTGIKEPEAKRYIEGNSGTVMEILRGGNERSENWREVLVPGVSPEMIQQANNTQELALLSVSPGKGYTQFHRPFLVRSEFHISLEEYQQRMKAELPLLPGQIVAADFENPAPQQQQVDQGKLNDILKRFGDPGAGGKRID